MTDQVTDEIVENAKPELTRTQKIKIAVGAAVAVAGIVSIIAKRRAEAAVPVITDVPAA